MIAGILLFCGASVFTACSSDDNAVDSIDSNESEMADYAILFYGYGGGNLDYDILNNIQQFYAADPASYDKVKIAVQYKFSSQEEFEEQMVADNVHSCNNDHIANADSLLAFIDWAAKACPAKHYVLLLSDHGAGYTPHDDLPYTPANSTRSFLIDNNKTERLTVNALFHVMTFSTTSHGLKEAIA